MKQLEDCKGRDVWRGELWLELVFFLTAKMMRLTDLNFKVNVRGQIFWKPCECDKELHWIFKFIPYVHLLGGWRVPLTSSSIFKKCSCSPYSKSLIFFPHVQSDRETMSLELVYIKSSCMIIVHAHLFSVYCWKVNVTACWGLIIVSWEDLLGCLLKVWT